MIKEIDRALQEKQVIDRIKRNLQLPITDLLDVMVAALKENFLHYTGIYVYLLEDETLVLGPYRGRPTEHTRIPIGAGIYGRAVRIKQTVMVDDVNADPEYLACSLETRSEIVVPIMRGDRVLGEIDIDSDLPAAFSHADKRFLEELAQLIAPKFVEKPLN